MLSQKTGDNEYTTRLVETINGIVISMMYKDNSNFPYKITVYTDGEIATGILSEHRKDTEDFDKIKQWRFFYNCLQFCNDSRYDN